MSTAVLPPSSRQRNHLELATFALDRDRMGIPVDQVDEIHHPADLTPVPHAPPCVRGVMNLRGEVVTVIDLRVILGYPPAVVTRQTCNMVVRWGGERVGLLVDLIGDVVSVGRENIEPPPTNIPHSRARFLRGVCKLDAGVLSVLDVEQVLSVDEEPVAPRNVPQVVPPRAGPS